MLDSGIPELRTPIAGWSELYRISGRCTLAPPVQCRAGMRCFVFALLLAGCEHDLVPATPDAPIDAVIAISGCPAPAQPLRAGAHKIYLNTEGVTLKTGCGDNAETGCTELVATTSVVPQFLASEPGRNTYIAQIVAAIETALAPYSVDIVTVRPAALPYQMVVLGGDPGTLTGGCGNCTAVSDRSCAPLGSVVDLVFDHGTTMTPVAYANTILDDIALLNGLVPTTTPGDCACRIDQGCYPVSSDVVCTFGSNEPTSMMASNDTPPTPLNCGHATQDEPKILASVWGCR